MYPEIRFVKRENLKAKPEDESKLGFGHIFTDYMFIMDYDISKGWYDPRIVPYGPMEMDPSSMVFHYGQAIFEGLKAYRQPDSTIRLFRPRLNFERANHSNERMDIPSIDVDFCLHALKTLLRIEADWVPTSEGTSLYIRPFIIAMDPYLGVRSAHQYRFMIILSPSGMYYPQGLAPVPIYVEEHYVRSIKGGTGEAKTPGNYAASIKAQEIAHEKGFIQVLWLDGKEHKYIEEVGSMNVFFVIDGRVVTPELSGSILPGITRRSCLELLRKWGYEVEERLLAVQEVVDAAASGKLNEAFGTGTAAVISPVGELNVAGTTYVLNENKIGAVSQRLYEAITGMQYGKIDDEMGWTEGLEEQP